MPLNMTYLQKLPGNKNFYWHVSTLCGLGFFSSMPGTVGSIAAFLVYPVLPVPLAAIIGIIVLGVWTSHRYAEQEGKNATHQRPQPTAHAAKQCKHAFLLPVGFKYEYF